METALFVGILSAVVTISTILGVGLYRIISQLNQRTQRIEHELTGNGVSDGLVGTIDDMQKKRQREHEQVRNQLNRQAEQQDKIIAAIENTEAIDITLNQNKDDIN